MSKLPRGHYEAIGRVACDWTDLMRLVDDAIWDLLETDWQKGRVVTQHLTDTVKLQMLEALAVEAVQVHYIATLKALRKVLKQIEALRLQRNQIVHGEHNRDLKRGRTHVVRYVWTARGNLKVKHFLVSVVETNSVARQIREAEASLFRVFHEEGLWQRRLEARRPAKTASLGCTS